MQVSDIALRAPDAAGAVILSIYAKYPPHYAIYRTAERVMVHYADDADEARRQVTLMAPLNPLRGEINGFIDGWRPKDATPGGQPARLPSLRAERRAARAKRYDRRVADALGVALEGDSSGSLALLTGIRTDILDMRTSWARLQYLVAASSISVLVIIGVCLVSPWAVSQPVRALWFSLIGGTVGAFFSIAIAIRSRNVLTDLHWTTNTADAVLRVVIGAIAALVLVGLVQLNAFALQIGDVDLSATGADPNYWLSALIVAFVGGFSERLIPDLLERSTLVAGVAGPLRQGAVVPPAAQPPPGAAAPGPQGPGNAQPAAMAGAAPLAHADDHEAHVDGCLCDVPVEPDEITTDEQLPVAVGGVAAARRDVPPTAPPAAGVQPRP